MSVNVTFSQNTLNGKDWLAVKCEPVKQGNWITPINGSIFTFADNLMSWRHVYSSNTIDFNYIVRNETLVLNDTAKMTINFLSEDSLKLILDNRMVVTFIPIQACNSDVNISTEELIGNNWIYKAEDFESRIDFLKYDWSMTANDMTKTCITHVERDKYCHQDKERWSIISINGINFLSMTLGQYTNYSHQIIRQNQDTIHTKLWNGDKFIYPQFIKQKQLNSVDKNKLFKTITSKKWQTFEVISNSTSFDEDIFNIEPSAEAEETGLFVVDTTLITKQDLLSNKIAFNFTETKYDILIDNKVFVSGKWQLSIDGKYIILNNGLSPNDYIKLFDVTNKNLVIGKSDVFSLKKSRHFVEYYYKLKLE